MIKRLRGILRFMLQDQDDDLVRARQLIEALDTLPISFALYGPDDRLVFGNEAYGALHRDAFAVLGPHPTYPEILRISGAGVPEAAGRLEEWVAERVNAQRESDGRSQDRIHADGSWMRVNKYRTPSGLSAGLGVDITDLKRREQALFEGDARYRALAHSSTFGILQTGLNGVILAVNPALIRMLGYSGTEALVGVRLHGVFDAGFMTVVEAAAPEASLTSLEVQATTAHGTPLTLLASVSHVVEDMTGRPVRMVSCVDISKRKEAEQRAITLALTDTLTGIANRNHFGERLRSEIAQIRGRRLALLAIDLDHFKPVNDLFGHHVGDAVLKAIAGRLSELIRPNDLVARLGGDEFAILVTDIDDPTIAHQCGERVVAALSSPIMAHGHDVRLGASVGYAVAPDDAQDVARLMQRADAALYRAKSIGRGTVKGFCADLLLGQDDGFVAKARLLQAFEDDRFELVFQPMLRIDDARIDGIEVLLRLRDPKDQALIGPDGFLPAAERAGLLPAIDRLVIAKAMVALARLADAGLPPLRVAINLSATTLLRPGFLDFIDATLGAHGLASEQIEFELTEALLLTNTKSTRNTLDGLRDRNVRLALDDFGTGYSAMSYLHQFRFDRLKLDRMFVSTLDQEWKSEAIVRASINLAHAFGMECVAEGVETLGQLERLHALGCDIAQGNLFARSMSEEGLARFVRQRLHGPALVSTA